MRAIGAARMSGHGVATTKTASARTGSPEIAHAMPATDSRDGEEDRGVAVREPHEGRPLLLGLLDQTDECGVGAFCGGPDGADLESTARTCGAASHLAALVDGDGEWFAGKRRLVDDRLVGLDHAVDRDDLPRSHEHVIADLDVIDRNFVYAVCSPDERDARSSLHQSGQFALGAAIRCLLERVAAGEHERDDRTRQVFAQRERTCHCDECDSIDPNVAA